MKSSKIVVGWRPVMGVAVVGAMALAVSALAGPRGDDQTVRGTVKSVTEVTRLVTGDPAQINAVVADGTDGGNGTAILAVNPVYPPQGICVSGACTSGASIDAVCASDAGCADMPDYPAGVTISGNELRIDRADNKDGFRAWFNVQLSNWDPKGDGPNLGAWQVKVNCSGYYQSDCLDVKDNTKCNGGVNAGLACLTDIDCPGGSCGLDLKPAAFIPCPGDDATPCKVAFGESWAACNGLGTGMCDAGYLSDSGAPRPDSWCTAGGGGCTGFGVAIATCNYTYFSVSNAIPGHPDFLKTCVAPSSRPGQGCNTDAQCPGGTADDCTGPRLANYYAGTLVLDIPAGAKGKYTVELDKDNTLISAPGPIVLDPLVESGFVINVVGGSCCHNLGSPMAGCFDQCINRSDCEKPENAPYVFTPGETCDAKPSDVGCAQCIIVGRNTDVLCDDGDACTDDDCTPLFICEHPPISGFNPVKGGAGDTGNCCDPATGGLTDKDDGDVCTRDYCSIAAGNRGVAVNDPVAAAGDSCDDGNSCSVNDDCDGVRSFEDGGCGGTLVNGLPCLIDADCQFGGQAPTAVCQADGTCFCTVTPKVTFVLADSSEKTPLCDGGINDGQTCKDNEDCPGGTCDQFADTHGANCFWEGEKIAALVHIGVAAEPINGGQLQINYDPSCVELKSVTCLFPYVTEIYRAIDTGAGKIFIACGVDPFGGVNGPGGNVDMLALQFNMIGECNNCDLCFESKNPQNSYLVDAGGYKVVIEGQCKELSEFGDLVLTVPDNIKVNSDCDVPSADVPWAAPSASFSCGDVNLTCRGAHTSGLTIAQEVIYGGGVLPQGVSSFCCYAWAKDKCDQVAGCTGAVNRCPGDPKPDGCWTVEVNDETSMDIHIQLEPPMSPDSDGDTRCIEFCLYGDCLQGPTCFEENVLFDGLYNYIGKASGKIKAPKGKWGCITAQDQLHSLRSCDNDVDCIAGQLVARFKGDPAYGGNWLVMGNLDGWKKNDPDEDPSLDVIDILDFGKFLSQFGVCYQDRKYGCHEGPHADIDGDGCVTSADYTFVLRNFMVSAKDCCCGPQAASLPPGLTEVTIEQLREMGEEDMIVADLNGDGVVNAADMDAFTQGVRPTKSNDRKGGKGLRSGR